MSVEINVDKNISDHENNKKGIVYTKKKDKELKKGIEEIEHKYKRALADYQNLLKRTAKEKQEFANNLLEAKKEACFSQFLAELRNKPNTFLKSVNKNSP